MAREFRSSHGRRFSIVVGPVFDVKIEGVIYSEFRDAFPDASLNMIRDVEIWRSFSLLVEPYESCYSLTFDLVFPRPISLSRIGNWCGVLRRRLQALDARTKLSCLNPSGKFVNTVSSDVAN